MDHAGANAPTGASALPNATPTPAELDELRRGTPARPPTGDPHYRALLASLPHVIVGIYDRELRGVHVEGRGLERTSLDLEKFRGIRAVDFMPPADRAVIEPLLNAALDGKHGALEFHPSRSDTAFLIEAHPWRPVEGGPIEGVFAVSRDVSAIRQAQRETDDRTRQQAAVASLGVAALEGMGIGVLCDAACTTIAGTLNLPFVELLEMTDDREALRLVAGAGWREGLVRRALYPAGSRWHLGFVWGSRGPVLSSDYANESRFERTALLIEHDAAAGAGVVVGGKRRPYGVLAAHSDKPRQFRRDEVDFIQSVANILAEAMARDSAEQAVRHQALHDALTGLPNRTLLTERIAHWSERPGRGEAAAVAFLDLDGFKLVNDALGHEAGDDLLRAVAKRLRETIRPSDTVARVGGDEFVVLYEDIPRDDEALRLVDELVHSLATPIAVGGREQHVRASIGVAFTDGKLPAADVIRNADAAMYRAKEDGRAQYRLFDERMHARSLERLELEAELRRAIAGDELRNVYQPIVSSETGEIVRFEALVRWEHPERGTVSPADFIPIAEQTGLIIPLGRCVLEAACAEAVRWQSVRPAELEPLLVSVNLSPRQLRDPALVETVEEVLTATGLAPEMLSLEITESALIDNAEAALATVRRIKALGVELDLDDFGTGYSSLSYVRNFPIDVLKIDRSFISGLDEGAHDEAIIQAVVALGKALDISVIAEGVETESQAEALRAIGCLLAQGYLWSRPLSASDALARASRA